MEKHVLISEIREKGLFNMVSNNCELTKTNLQDICLEFSRVCTPDDEDTLIRNLEITWFEEEDYISE